MTGLTLRHDGPALTVEIDRGETNAFSAEMIDGLAAAVERDARDDAVRFVRIRARGPVFCTGRDRGGGSPDEVRAEAERIVRLNELLRTVPLIVICEVEGDAAGFGAGMVAAADVAILAEGARLWFPELAAGLAPTIVLSWLGPLVGVKRAFELVATGRRVEAAEALELGLVTEAVAPADVARRGDEWLAALAGTGAAALADVKRFLAHGRGVDEPAAARASVDALAVAALRVQAGAANG